MNKQTTFLFTFRNYNKIKDSEDSHKLILKLLPFQKQTTTPYTIPPKHWDGKAQQVKRKYWEQHPELVKQINHYKDKFVKYYKLLANGEIQPENACSEILFTTAETVKNLSIIEYMNENAAKFGKSQTTREKYKSQIRGIEKALLKFGSKYKELKVSMLKDEKAVMEISEAVNQSNISTTTKKDYLNTLDSVSRKALKVKYHNPFKLGGYIGKAIPDGKKMVTSEKMMNGLKDIETYKDIEAYLLWLYSFCLQGLDLVDIACIDESKITDEYGVNIGANNLTHFHNFGDLIGTVIKDKNNPLESRIEYRKQLCDKWYLSGVRAKSAGKIDCLYNLFPTLYIRDWLHQIMQLTSPDIVYRGKDRFRLFNVMPRNSKYLQDFNATKKVKIWGDYLTRRQKKLFGANKRLSRQTYTQFGKKYFGFTEGQMQYQLNHSLKGAINTYQKGEDAVDIRDFRHHQLVNMFEVNDILHFLRKSTLVKYKSGQLIYQKKVKAVPSRVINGKRYKSQHKPPFESWNNNMLIANAFLMHSYDSKWTKELQQEYDMLVMHIKNTPMRVENELGLPDNIYLTPDHPKYPKRILELNEIRKEAFGDIKFMISEKGGIALTPDTIENSIQEENNMNVVNEIIEKG